VILFPLYYGCSFGHMTFHVLSRPSVLTKSHANSEDNMYFVMQPQHCLAEDREYGATTRFEAMVQSRQYYRYSERNDIYVGEKNRLWQAASQPSASSAASQALALGFIDRLLLDNEIMMQTDNGDVARI
jgi:hypothetical protein